MIPVVGVLAVASFIIIYVGISAAILFIFREIDSLKPGTLDSMRERHRELLDMKKAIERKYYKRRLDQEAFRQIVQDYERQLTELEVRMKGIKKK